MPRVNVTFSEKDFEELNKLEKMTGKKKSEIVREFYFKGLQIDGANEGLGIIAEVIHEQLKSILDPQVERLASISAKSAITSATSMYLNAQALVDFVPKEKQKEFVEVYEKARLKGIAYVKKRTIDMEELKKED